MINKDEWIEQVFNFTLQHSSFRPWTQNFENFCKISRFLEIGKREAAKILKTKSNRPKIL